MSRLSVLALMLICSTAVAQSKQEVGGPKVNATVFFFFDASVLSVITVTEVFGRSQNITAAIVELAAPVKAGSLSATSFTVDDRTITAVKVTGSADVNAPESDGRFVVLSLDPADAASLIYDGHVDTAAEVFVSLTKAISAEGEMLAPSEKAVMSTRVQNLIVDDFQIFRFTDPATGLTLDYRLCLNLCGALS